LIEAGDRALVNTGLIEFYGKTIANTMTRLTAIANVGATSIAIDSALTAGWKVGDQIGLAGSSYSINEQEIVTILSISGSTINFSPALQFKHYGSSDDAKYLIEGIDMRTEVLLLTRNIRI